MRRTEEEEEDESSTCIDEMIAQSFSSLCPVCANEFHLSNYSHPKSSLL